MPRGRIRPRWSPGQETPILARARTGTSAPPSRWHSTRPGGAPGAAAGGAGWWRSPGAPPHRRRPAGFRSGNRRARSMDVSLIIVIVVVTALAFDFTNGFHDTANAMATSIATGAFRPRTAVAIAACLNVAGAFLSVQVAKTISGGLVDETLISPVVIFSGLVGAILWNLVTWFLGLPSSSSHALFGGLIGATWVAGGA